jgi:cyanate lyase
LSDSMRATLTEAKQETRGNLALNRRENPSWPAIENGQFTLGSAEEKCRTGAVAIAVAAKESRRTNGYSLGTVASLVGKETPYVSKCLDKDDPHSALQMVVATLLLDTDHSFLRAIARMRGCDVIERPTLTPEQKLERLLETLDRHGEMGKALAREAFGEDA